MANILVVDDELGIRDLLSEILNDEGHNVELAENAAQARAARGRSRPDLVLLDIWMPDTDGVTLLKEWSTTGMLSMPVIMMSGHATIETAVEATKIGAQSFLEKPITMQKLLKAVEAGLARTSRAAARKPGVAGAAPAPAVELTVEAAMTGGQALPPVVEMGPQARQLFELDKPLRDARDEFEKSLLRIPPGQGRRLDDARGRKDRAGTHPPVPQAQAAGRRSVAGQARGLIYNSPALAR